jgi:protein SCO1
VRGGCADRPLSGGRSRSRAHARGPTLFGLFAATLMLALGPSVLAHELPAGSAPLGFAEKLGGTAALEARFTGEDGASLRFGDLVDRPVLLNFVYYRCTNECNSLLVGIAQALHGVDAEPGSAYRVVTVSVNEAELPADALAKKSIALASVEKPFPPSAWRFLVGSDEEIDRLADSVGFSYAKNGDDYDHPLGLIVLSPKGKIVRYMTGADFLPVDLSMSLLEASSGLVRPTIAKMLRFCMSYNPQSRQFGFNVLRVSGIVISSLVGALVLFLVLSGKRRRRGSQGR